ncbi:MAG: MFS transporter [Moraxella sp.]|nr:MFS transporter [Moraxella sp.]
MPSFIPTSPHVFLVCIASLVASVGFFAVMIFLQMTDVISSLFFIGQHKDWLYYLQIMGLFVITYVAMPLGGLMIGRYGDSYGRQPALMMSLFGVAICTTIMGLLPTTTQIGVIAPLLFIPVKLGQSMAFGGLVPTLWVFVSEHLPSHRVGVGLGVISASSLMALLVVLGLTFILESKMTHEQILQIGWRIPFVVSGVLGLLLLMFVRHLDETPAHTQIATHPQIATPTLSIHTFTQLSQDHEQDGFFYFIKKYLAVLLPAITLTWLSVSLMVIIALLLPSLINTGFIISENLLRLGNVISIIFMMIGCVFYGFMVDYSNAGKVMSIGGVFFILQTMLFFGHLGSGGELILVFFALLGFSGGIIATAPVVAVRLFNVSSRLTYVGLIYAMMYALVSSALPFVLGYATFYVRLAPALYLALVVITAVFISFYVYHLPPTQAEKDDQVT